MPSGSWSFIFLKSVIVTQATWEPPLYKTRVMTPYVCVREYV